MSELNASKLNFPLQLVITIISLCATILLPLYLQNKDLASQLALSNQKLDFYQAEVQKLDKKTEYIKVQLERMQLSLVKAGVDVELGE